MGLDTVELVMAVEEEFGLPLPDSVCEGLVTPRLLIDYLEAQQNERASKKCQSQHCFYQLRRAFVEGGVCERSGFTLDATLCQLVPQSGRRAVWSSVANRLELTLPALQHSKCALSLLTCALMLFALLQFYTLYSFTPLELKYSLVITVFTLLLELSIYASNPLFAVHFQSPNLAPRDVVEWQIKKWPNAVISPSNNLSREQIADKVRRITLGFCEERDYSEDAHFIRDLGLD